MKQIDPAIFGHMLYTQYGTKDIQGRDDFCHFIMTYVFRRLQVETDNGVSGAAPQARILHLGALDRNEAAAALGPGASAIPGNAPASINIGILGETHRVVEDAQRSVKLISRLGSTAHPENCLVIEERGLRNINQVPTYRGLYASESTIVSAQFSELQRSVAIAAYVFLCLSGGDQSKRSRVLVVIGENHVTDLYELLEHFVDKCDLLPWVKARTRNYFLLTSQA